MKNDSNPGHAGAGVAAVLASLVVQNMGAAFAKQLFSAVGPAGMTALRIGIAAVLLIVMRQAWKKMPQRRHLPVLLVYGATLGLMNAAIYQAFARIPIGVAIAIEVLGPLSVALLAARRLLDLAWLAAAGLGLWLLLPLGAAPSSLDPVGIACALGAAGAWALYILYGKRAAHFPDTDVLAWGMAFAALLTVPYTLEMWALRRLPISLFGVLAGSSPAVAALAAYAILGEQLSAVQWTAIAAISGAVMGSTLTARKTT